MRETKEEIHVKGESNFLLSSSLSVERVVKVLTKWEVSHNAEKVSLPKHGQ